MVSLMLLAFGPTNRCELSTASGTGELRLVGTVHFLDVEGGCWRLTTETGRHYELQPEQAPPSVLRHAARVSLVAEPAEPPGTACRVGLPIDVRRVVSVSVAG
jgi:hypothetical protein